MKYIHLKPFFGEKFKHNKIFEINSGDNVFYGFRKKLKNKDIIIDTFDIVQEGKTSVTVYCDVPYPWQVGLWLGLIQRRTKNILLTFESPLVNPFSHLKLFHSWFDKIFTWNDILVDGTRYKKFYISQLDDCSASYPKFDDKKLITLINSNKHVFSLLKLISPFKTDLYKHRIEAIRFFEKNASNEFDLWGKGWSRNEYPSYRGTIPERGKLETLKQYKFCIAFENTIAPGYITEKIFDCLKCGVIPIYFGAPNINDFIPRSAFIDMRNYKSFEDLLIYIQNMGKDEYERLQKEGKKFIASESTQSTWFEKAFERVFITEILDDEN